MVISLTSAADTILPPAVTRGASDGTDGWRCDPWFKTQVKAVASEFADDKLAADHELT